MQVTRKLTGNTFTKAERICDRKSIKELFSKKSSSFYFYPYKLVFLPSASYQSRILVSVPKRRFKRANKRNLLKRRIKEAYRLNKQYLFEGSSKNWDIAILYVGKEVHDFNFLEKKLISVFEHVLSKDSKDTSATE